MQRPASRVSFNGSRGSSDATWSRVSAVLEGKTSGLGSSPTRRHWHFVVAAPEQHKAALLRTVPLLWEELFGNCKTQAYDPRLPGAAYIAKTADSTDFDWEMHNLERIYTADTRDLFAQQQTDPYVPVHARDLARGETLAMRPTYEKGSAAPLRAPAQGKTPTVSRNTGGSHGRNR